MGRLTPTLLAVALLALPLLAATPTAAASTCQPSGDPVDDAFCTAHATLNFTQAVVNCFYKRPPSDWLDPCPVPV